MTAPTNRSLSMQVVFLRSRVLERQWQHMTEEEALELWREARAMDTERLTEWVGLLEAQLASIPKRTKGAGQLDLDLAA
jgi:hypothetical protein